MLATQTRILFLCTGNSARSIMAEAVAKEMFGERLDAVSAGSRPKAAPHPLALKTLETHGISADDLASKSWDAIKDDVRGFDLAVTLCDSAAKEECPIWPGAPLRAHWGFPDPPQAADPPAMFERVFQGLVEAIGILAADDDAPLDVKAGKAAELVKQWFPESAIVP
jgi:protein-tyrosine-phosphatase